MSVHDGEHEESAGAAEHTKRRQDEGGTVGLEVHRAFGEERRDKECDFMQGARKRCVSAIEAMVYIEVYYAKHIQGACFNY